jgi:hypothetical protein
MEDSELDQMIKNFVKECEEKNLNGIAVVADPDNKKAHIGISTNYMKGIFLLRSVLEKLQELTGISSALLATHLALIMAVLNIDKTRTETLEKVDSEILEKASLMVQRFIDIQLAQTKFEEAGQSSTTSKILH